MSAARRRRARLLRRAESAESAALDYEFVGNPRGAAELRSYAERLRRAVAMLDGVA